MKKAPFWGDLNLHINCLYCFSAWPRFSEAALISPTLAEAWPRRCLKLLSPRDEFPAAKGSATVQHPASRGEAVLRITIIILLIVPLLVFSFGGYRMGPGLGYYGGGGLSLYCSGRAHPIVVTRDLGEISGGEPRPNSRRTCQRGNRSARLLPTRRIILSSRIQHARGYCPFSAISSAYRCFRFMPIAAKIARSERAVRPCLPISLPRSVSAT